MDDLINIMEDNDNLRRSTLSCFVSPEFKKLDKGSQDVLIYRIRDYDNFSDDLEVDGLHDHGTVELINEEWIWKIEDGKLYIHRSDEGEIVVNNKGIRNDYRN